MNIITNAFTKGYCEVTAIDSLVMIATVLVLFFVCHFSWFVYTEFRKKNK